MKKLFLLSFFLTFFCVNIFSQKVTVTKPSVAELISVMDSKKPLKTLDNVASKNGYVQNPTYGKEYSYSKFQHQLIYMVMHLNTRGLAWDIGVQTYTKSVVDSWMAQLKRLGYLFDGKTIGSQTVSGNYTTSWHYSKPSGYSIEIKKSDEVYWLSISR